MRREQLEHVIRAAASVLGEDAVIVIGSQAIHGSVPEERLPPDATESIEADVIPFDGDEAKSELIDGSIGEASLFHESFGVYAQGVVPQTAKLAPGWRDRLVPLRGPGTHDVTGWCLESHDLVAAKLIAGREKDVRFYRALRDASLIDPDVIAERIRITEGVDDRTRTHALDLMRRVV